MSEMRIYSKSAEKHPLPENLRRQLVDPIEISAKSKQKVRWICPLGHEWLASPGDRSRTDGKASGCPECGRQNRIESYSAQAAVRNPLSDALREELVVDGVYSAGSDKKVEWQCSECSNKWIASIASRTRGTGCPKCASVRRGRSRTLASIRANGHLTGRLAREVMMANPADIPVKSKSRVDWVCEDCGKKWSCVVLDRTRPDRPSGCPNCCRSRQFSAGERDLQDFVESLGYLIIRNDRQVIKPLELDIYIPELNAGIEYNGSYWHTPGDEKGLRKEHACNIAGIKLLTIWDFEWSKIGAKKYVRRWLQDV